MGFAQSKPLDRKSSGQWTGWFIGARIRQVRRRWGRVVAVGACTGAVASSLATVLPARAASVQRRASLARPAAPLIISVAGRGLGILVDWTPASASETVTSYELTALPVVTASVPFTCKKAARAKVRLTRWSWNFVTAS